MDHIAINGLELPPPLVRALRDGSWTSPKDSHQLSQIFVGFPFEGQPATFYSEPQIVAANADWVTETGLEWLGHRDDDPPGDIDPTMSLLVADLASTYRWRWTTDAALTRRSYS